MFKTKNNIIMSKVNVSENSVALNLIAAGTSIIGDIKSNGDIRIDGSLKGSLITNGKIIIGESGVVDGHAKGKNADILGNFKGEIVVAELLYLKGTSVLNGDIIANKVAIDAGATFTGSCAMGEVKNISQNPPLEIQDMRKEKTA